MPISSSARAGATGSSPKSADSEQRAAAHAPIEVGHVDPARISGAEKIVVVSVILAAIVFEVWFFFFSGSSIGAG